nr:hypothetical protein [Escherichia coli]
MQIIHAANYSMRGFSLEHEAAFVRTATIVLMPLFLSNGLNQILLSNGL